MTTQGQAAIALPTAARRIEKEIPISGIDQFGSLERYMAKPQYVSRIAK
jgi:hypothetical protein